MPGMQLVYWKVFARPRVSMARRPATLIMMILRLLTILWFMFPGTMPRFTAPGAVGGCRMKKNGKNVDPRKVKAPSEKSLPKHKMKEFQNSIKPLMAQLGSDDLLTTAQRP